MEQTDGRKCRQTLAACPCIETQFKQQRQESQRQRRFKNDFILNRRISRKSRFIQLVKSVRNIRENSKMKFKKIGRPSSRSLEYAECGYFTLLCCKGRQINYKQIITNAYTHIVLVAVPVAVEVCSLNSLKLNK